MLVNATTAAIRTLKEHPITVVIILLTIKIKLGTKINQIFHRRFRLPVIGRVTSSIS